MQPSRTLDFWRFLIWYYQCLKRLFWKLTLHPYMLRWTFWYFKVLNLVTKIRDTYGSKPEKFLVGSSRQQCSEEMMWHSPNQNMLPLVIRNMVVTILITVSHNKRLLYWTSLPQVLLNGLHLYHICKCSTVVGFRSGTCIKESNLIFPSSVLC